MILCVYEGKRETAWFQSIKRLFLKDEYVECFVVDGTFHNLYKSLVENGWDVVGAFRQIENRKGERNLSSYKESDFSEVYLFFDYDPHSRHSIGALNSELCEMLAFFDNETENGKLYVNYPMIEALRYTKQLPDREFTSYKVDLSDCRDFKRMVAEFSFYPNNNFIDGRGTVSDEEARENWMMLKTQNVVKANAMCHNKCELPSSKEDVSQMKIFIAQRDKYLSLRKPQVAILSAYALFLYDYLR